MKQVPSRDMSYPVRVPPLSGSGCCGAHRGKAQREEVPGTWSTEGQEPSDPLPGLSPGGPGASGRDHTDLGPRPLFP